MTNQKSLFSTYICDCGFKGNTLETEKHLKKFWTFENDKVSTNGHKATINEAF